jgi:copper resistance protein B
MIRLALISSLAALAAAPVAAQQMDHSHMPGMQTPAQASPPPTAAPAAAAPASAPEAPPAWTGDYAADRYYDPAAMAHARMMAREEMGGMRFSKVMLNLAEYQTGAHGDGYRWDGQAWFGGDVNRFVLRSEGEGRAKDGLESAEAQALYSRAVGRYLDVQAGVRQDFSPHPRTYLALGAQSLLPYWFEVEGSVFLSTKGEVLARAEGTYDLRLTQRLVLQPRAELNFAAQSSRETRTGSGLSNAELGLRLRYEIRREFAPYIGVSWDKRFGRTADYDRAAGESPEATTFVVGLRTWF